jgi:hypothetical protein
MKQLKTEEGCRIVMLQMRDRSIIKLVVLFEMPAAASNKLSTLS